MQNIVKFVTGATACFALFDFVFDLTAVIYVMDGGTVGGNHETLAGGKGTPQAHP
jgi:hypothetical protein